MLNVVFSNFNQIGRISRFTEALFGQLSVEIDEKGKLSIQQVLLKRILKEKQNLTV